MIEWDVLVGPNESLFERDEVFKAAAGDKPIVEDNSKLYYEAFRVLTTSRQMMEGGYLGFISYSNISEYAKRNYIDDFDIFLFIIQEVDAMYVKMLNKIVESKQKSNK